MSISILSIFLYILIIPNYYLLDRNYCEQKISFQTRDIPH